MPSSSTMPSEHTVPLAQQPPEQTPQQIKVCSACHRPLSGDSATPFMPYDGEDASDTSIVCLSCRSGYLALRMDVPPPVSTARGEVLFAQVERELRRRAAFLQTGDNEADSLQLLAEPINHPPAQLQHASPPQLDEDVEMDSPVVPRPTAIPSPDIVQRALFVEGSSYDTPTSLPSRKALTVVVNHGAAPNQPQAPTTSHAMSSPVAMSPWASTSRERAQSAHHAPAHPDPLVDITRLRVRSQGHHCLYPGATFQGTQKSGRNSYDVSVTIVVSHPKTKTVPRSQSLKWLLSFRTLTSRHPTCADTSTLAG